MFCDSNRRRLVHPILSPLAPRYLWDEHTASSIKSAIGQECTSLIGSPPKPRTTERVAASHVGRAARFDRANEGLNLSFRRFADKLSTWFVKRFGVNRD
jgi:hypothetical protein